MEKKLTRTIINNGLEEVEYAIVNQAILLATGRMTIGDYKSAIEVLNDAKRTLNVAILYVHDRDKYANSDN